MTDYEKLHDEAEPCPFCGSNHFRTVSYSYTQEQIQCNSCGAMGPAGPKRGGAFTVWNMRRPIPGNYTLVVSGTLEDDKKWLHRLMRMGIDFYCPGIDIQTEELGSYRLQFALSIKSEDQLMSLQGLEEFVSCKPDLEQQPHKKQ